MLTKHEYANGSILEHCTACKSMWYSSPRDRLLKNIRQPYEAKFGRSVDISRCPDCTARLKTYERALRELRADKTGGKPMTEPKNLLSETAVNEFIEAVKIIANASGSKIRISRHDEALMRMHLAAKPVDKTGIAVVIKPRQFDISSSRFRASWSRR